MAKPQIDWDNGLEDEVINRITAGEPVHELFKDERLPSKNAFYLKCARDVQFESRIARARKHGAIAQFDDLVRLADTADERNFNAIKLRIWTRQWVLARLNPALYGDKAVHSWDENSPLEIVIRRVGMAQEALPEPQQRSLPSATVIDASVDSDAS